MSTLGTLEGQKCRECGLLKPLNAYFKGQITCKACSFARRAARLAGEPLPPRTPKSGSAPPKTLVCKRCGLEKVLEDYYWRDGDPRKYSKTCKKCASERQRVNFYGPESLKLLSEARKCAICGSEFDLTGSRDPRHVDHCHATGKVRGVLCGTCNIGLGNFKDSPLMLNKALSYLLEAKTPV